jgi:peptidoglycan-associated lipoprotein
MKNSNELVLLAVGAICLAGAGCAKKPVAVVTPPATPAAAAAPAPRATPATPPARAAATPAPAAAAPTPRFPDAATRARIDQLLARIQDAYFDYDKHSLRPDALKTLEADSKELRDIIVQYPEYKLTIEGYCDERGSAEYNAALGDSRARAAKEYLVNVGIPDGQLLTVSYGKERQICDEHDETCWQKNRRVHIIAMAR